MNLSHRVIIAAAGILLIGGRLPGQDSATGLRPQPGTPARTESSGSTESESKRIFGIIPNNRTSPTFEHFEPITARQKFKIATSDSFDRGTFLLAGLFAGEAQLTNSNRAFGQGAAGYGQYYGASFGDFTIGNYMTEAIYPSLLHQDPRYFRKSTGSNWSRFGYAVGQIFWTHTDSAETQFNYSEILGNSTAVAISNAYYVDNRTAHQAVGKLGVQLGVDAASNILKEFWPDFERRFARKHRPE